MKSSFDLLYCCFEAKRLIWTCLVFSFFFLSFFLGIAIFLFVCLSVCLSLYVYVWRKLIVKICAAHFPTNVSFSSKGRWFVKIISIFFTKWSIKPVFPNLLELFSFEMFFKDIHRMTYCVSEHFCIVKWQDLIMVLCMSGYNEKGTNKNNPVKRHLLWAAIIAERSRASKLFRVDGPCSIALLLLTSH